MAGKSIKKWLKKVLITNALFVAFVLSGYFVFQSKVVQTYIISLITSSLAQGTGAEISIKHVDIALFSKVILDEVYLSDQHKDTLLYVNKMVANIDSLSFLKKKIHLKNITFKQPKINLEKLDSSFNFSFLLSNLSLPQEDTNWKVFCSSFKVNSGEIVYRDAAMNPSWQEFFHFYDIGFSIDNARLKGSQLFLCELNNFHGTSKNGMDLKKLSSEISYSDSILSFKSVIGNTVFSKVKADSVAINFTDFLKTNRSLDIGYYLKLNYLDLAFKDISFLLESFKDKDFRAYASGEVKGKVDDIKGKDVTVSIGDFTKINGNFYINGLPDWEHAYLFLDLKESYANFKQLRYLDLPLEISNLYSNFPDFLSDLGEFSYKGNFSGFIDDFVAYGTAYSNLGIVRSDISVKPLPNKYVNFNGKITSKRLNVGTLFSNEDLGKLWMNGNLNGTINTQNNQYKLKFKGEIDSLDYKYYQYHKIQLNGNLENKKFEGTLSINDPNLKMDYSGKLDLVPTLPMFEFKATIDHANLKMLHVVDQPVSVLSTKINANFIGNSIDNVVGELQLSDINYKNKNDSLYVARVQLRNNTRGDSSIFTINSDLVEGEIRGKYSFLNIGYSFIKFYRNYFPSTYLTHDTLMDKTINHFNFNFKVKNIDPITSVFAPNWKFEHNFSLKGKYNTTDQTANLETTIPLVKHKGIEIENLRILFDANNSVLKSKIKAENLQLSEGLTIGNFSVDAEGAHDKLAINLFYNNNGTKTYSGNLKTVTTFSQTNTNYPHIVIQIDPSRFYFEDSLWVIDRSEVQIDSSRINFDKLSLKHQNHLFYVDGTISQDPKDELVAMVQNIELRMFEPLMGESGFTGNLNGRAKISEIYNQFKMDLNLALNKLTFSENGYLGELTLASTWNNDQNYLDAEIYMVKNEETILESHGFIDPVNAKLDLDIEFNKSPISVIQAILPDIFYNEGGLGSGKVRLHGDLAHLKHDGKVTPDGVASFGIAPINTTYYTSNSVVFKGDSIVFPNMKFTDKYGNSGIFDGYLRHTSFMDMRFDMKVTGTNVLVMNTTSAQNEDFYGTAFATGTFNITGNENDILLSGDFKSAKGTTINIPFETGESAQQYDFIEIIKPTSQQVVENKYKVANESLNMEFDVELTPDAKFQIIFISQLGDIIKGEGNGNLKVKVDKNFNIQLYGDYVIEKGDYLFTLQNVINKRFTIDRGGTLKWIGDPYNALVDLSAVYRVKTSLYDLFMSNEQDIDLTKRLPIDCIINLSENLLYPKIDFKIDLPTAEDRIKDQVGQLIVTQEDINRQILSLLLLGRFYTPEIFAGKPPTSTGAELVGTTTTEVLTNQLSNWLSKITDVVDVGIKYRPGNEISNEQVELALSTQILNDRVTIDGNIANNAKHSSNNNSDFIGDVDVNVKLTDDGKLKMKAYNHSNDDLIYDTAPYTWGIGLSYREEFDSFKELLIKYNQALFNRSKKKKIKTNEGLEE